METTNESINQTIHLEYNLDSNVYDQTKDDVKQQAQKLYKYVSKNIDSLDINIRVNRIASYNDYVKGVKVESIKWSKSGDDIIAVDCVLEDSFLSINPKEVLSKVILDVLNDSVDSAGVNLVVVPVEVKENKNISYIVNKILEGVDIKEAIIDEPDEAFVDEPGEAFVDEPGEAFVDEPGEAFVSNAKKFQSGMPKKYSFISKIDLDISSETKYISNFFINVYTKLDYYFPEGDIQKFDLSDILKGEKVYYGIDDSGTVEHSFKSICHDISDLLYKESFKFGLVPVSTRKSYSIMRYSKDTYYYHFDMVNEKIKLRLEFYTDTGLKTKD